MRYVAPFVFAVLAVNLMGCQQEDCDMPTRPSPFPSNTTRAPSDPSALEYWILASEPTGSPEDDGYDNDSTLGFCGNALGGRAVIWVNGSPAKIIGEGGEMFRISEWLHPGQSQVHVTGDFTEPFYIKVIALRQKTFRAPDFHFEHIVAKSRVTPPNTNVVAEPLGKLSFSADIDYSPFFDELPEDDLGRRKVELEIRSYLELIVDLIRKHDCSTLASVSFAPWGERPRWGASQRSSKLKWKEIVEDVNQELTTQVNECEILIGARSALVVSGADEAMKHGFHSLAFKHRKTGRISYVQPICLIRVKGRWEVWDR